MPEKSTGAAMTAETLVGGSLPRLRWSQIKEEGDLSFSERTVHQLGLSASCAFGNFAPGILFRIPADNNLNNITSLVFGLNAAYRLP